MGFLRRDAPPPFEAVIDLRDDPRVRVRGEIDVATAAQFQESVMEAARAGAPVTIDMRETTFIDSTGLSVIMRLVTSLADPPDPTLVVVASPAPAVRKTFMITGIDRLVTIQTD